jgi:metal-responsive CopG/Arc/MetJ family transcriptional regulator
MKCIVVPEVKSMRTVLSVSLPNNMAAELEAFARTTGRNKSDIV